MTPEELKKRQSNRLDIEREMYILQAAASNELFPSFPPIVTVKNISEGGICVVSDSELRAGTVLEAEILLRSHDLERFKVFCQAVWTKKSTGGYETGMQFLGIKETDGMQLKQYIKEHYN